MADFGPIIDASALADSLGDEEIRVVDCRFDLADPNAGREAWLKGHVPGAVFLDLEADLSGPVRPSTGRHPLPEIGSLGRAFGRCGIGPTTRVVVYDALTGGIAARAWWLLRWLGHEHVALLERGYAGWVSDGHATETGEVRVQEVAFSPRQRAGRVISTAEVAASVNSPASFRLVDAREAARYRGEHEPIDTIAGRVPGALNLPYSELLDDEGRFLDRSALRGKFAGVIGRDDDKAWTAMCGSGVTACHLAIAAQLAGYREPSLYAGSFSEWIRDSTRPVEAG